MWRRIILPRQAHIAETPEIDAIRVTLAQRGSRVVCSVKAGLWNVRVLYPQKEWMQGCPVGIYSVLIKILLNKIKII